MSSVKWVRDYYNKQFSVTVTNERVYFDQARGRLAVYFRKRSRRHEKGFWVVKCPDHTWFSFDQCQKLVGPLPTRDAAKVALLVREAAEGGNS